MAVNSGAGRSQRVLIVDDNVALAENISEILALEGYDTDVAASAEEALPKALSDDLDFIVTDHRLPGITGTELVERVRHWTTRIRFIVISGHTDERTTKEAERAGARFFPKPVNLQALATFMRASHAPA